MIADRAEHTLEDIWENKIASAILIKIAYDTLIFINQMAGTHQFVQQVAKQDADTVDQSTVHDIMIPGLDDIPEPENPDSPVQQINASMDSSNLSNLADCTTSVDPHTNIIGAVVKYTVPDQCLTIKEAAQGWFEISTGSMNATQEAQHKIISTALQKDTPFYTTYVQQHEVAKSTLNNLAFADNQLHIILLFAGAIAAFTPAIKYGFQHIPKYTKALKQSSVNNYHKLKQAPYKHSFDLATSMPSLAAIGAAGYGLSTGEFSWTMMTAAVVGALAGKAITRKTTQWRDNKKTVMELNEGLLDLFDGNVENLPKTSLDKKKKHYVRNTLGLTALTYAGIITANNTGLINDQSPDWLLTVSDYAAIGFANASAVLTALVYDRFEDIAYHQVFFGSGFGLTFATIAGGITSYSLAKNHGSNVGKKLKIHLTAPATLSTKRKSTNINSWISILWRGIRAKSRYTISRYHT